MGAMRTLLTLLPLVISTTVSAGDWPQWLGAEGDSRWEQAGLVEKFPAGGPKVVWRAPVANGYSGPAVAGGKVYVMDYQIATGVVDANPGGRTKLTGKERVVCLDEKTGKQLWAHSYDSVLDVSFPNGPRCTPSVVGGKVYALGGSGHLAALDAATGKVVWEKDLIKTYGGEIPIWGVAGSPLVKDGVVYAIPGGKGSAVVALDAATGKELWKAGDTVNMGYAPPVLWQRGGKSELLAWLPDALHGLDPASGKIRWSQPFKPAYGMSIMAPRAIGDTVFVGGMGKKSMLVKPADGRVEIVWEGQPNQSIHPKNGTPVVEDGVLYGCDTEGECLAVKAVDGSRLWGSMAIMGNQKRPSGTFFMARANQYFVIFNDLGELILAQLTPEKYTELDRAKVLEPTTPSMGRTVVWCHPAFANGCVFVRNDKEMLCLSLLK